jgi:thiol:disulfide interchange protein
MRHKLALLFVVGSLLTGVACAPAPVERPFVELSFDAALAEAKRTNKHLMIDFFTTWCGPCKKLDQVTWKDARVVEWIDETCVALKLDAERETGLAVRFKVTGYPTIVFVDASGTEIDRLVGYHDADEFLRASRSVLESKGKWDRMRSALPGK